MQSEIRARIRNLETVGTHAALGVPNETTPQFREFGHECSVIRLGVDGLRADSVIDVPRGVLSTLEIDLRRESLIAANAVSRAANRRFPRDSPNVLK